MVLSSWRRSPHWLHCIAGPRPHNICARASPWSRTAQCVLAITSGEQLLIKGELKTGTLHGTVCGSHARASGCKLCAIRHRSAQPLHCATRSSIPPMQTPAATQVPSASEGATESARLVCASSMPLHIGLRSLPIFGVWSDACIRAKAWPPWTGSSRTKTPGGFVDEVPRFDPQECSAT